MPLRDEEAKQSANCRERACYRTRRNAGAAQPLEVLDDVDALDALEIDALVAEPVAEVPQIG
jgi:hypothetical protein